MERNRRIGLGTAQFGMPYGINNKRGKVPAEEAGRIVKAALEAGVELFDTAAAYGESEKLLGDSLISAKTETKIVSKIPACRHEEVEGVLRSSLENLGVEKLYGCLVHDFASYKNDPFIWDELEKAKRSGLVDKIGFSLYYTQELDALLKNSLDIGLIQVPFSVFDQRFAGYMRELKKRGIEVHSRSVFLQGLVFRSPEGLEPFFGRIRGGIEGLRSLSRESGVPLAALCLNFALLNTSIDKVIVGVDSLENLSELLNTADFSSAVDRVSSKLSGLKIYDEEMLLPFNWKLAGARS